MHGITFISPFSGLGSLSQLIRLWSKSYYRFALNRKSYFADTVSTHYYAYTSD
nr:MAG TPA: hypothetical protein [Caudoviricetes sp.]